MTCSWPILCAGLGFFVVCSKKRFKGYLDKKKIGLWLLRGYLDCVKTVYDPFYGLFVVGFVNWFMTVCGMSKRCF